MARVKDWMFDMETYVWEACSKNMSMSQTVSYVKSKMKNVDVAYVEKVYRNMEQ